MASSPPHDAGGLHGDADADPQRVQLGGRGELCGGDVEVEQERAVQVVAIACQDGGEKHGGGIGLPAWCGGAGNEGGRAAHCVA